MVDIKQRELKMQERRKNTPWRDFVKDICSRTPVVFYRNNSLISRFPADNRLFQDVISIKEFESYRESLTSVAKEYEYTKSLLEQIKELCSTTKVPSMMHFGDIENSDYSDVVVSSKNIYLSSVVTFDSEDVMYSQQVRMNSKRVINSVMVWDNSENVYFCTGAISSYNSFYSKYIIGSNNIWFSSNLLGCSECISCNDLENQSYCIHNIKYSKEDYQIKKQELLQEKTNFMTRYLALNNKGKNFGSRNSENSLCCIECDDTTNCLYSYRLHTARNTLFWGGTESGSKIYDGYSGGSPYGNDVFCGSHIGKSENVYCSSNILGCQSIYYSYLLENCSYCLGCIGLKNKSFCILNKEYSKEGRYKLTNEIFAHMDADGILGTFFPASMNPFYFNDTAAYLMDDSFPKEEIIKEGYLWRDEEIKVDIPAGAEVVKTGELSEYQGFDENGQRTINPEILKKVIRDEKGNYYRIVPMELEFLKKHGLPLPELHRLERIKLGFKFK